MVHHFCAVAGCMILLPSMAVGQAASIHLNSGTQPACAVTFGLALEAASGTGMPAALQWTLHYSQEQFSAVQVSEGEAADAAQKTLSCVHNPGSTTCLLTGLNTSVILNGPVARFFLELSPARTGDTAEIELTSAVAASPAGDALPVNGTDLNLPFSADLLLPPYISPPRVVNAASLLSGAVAPGELISIFGCGMGPQPPLHGSTDGSGRLETTIAGTIVRFDDQPAPLHFASTGQVNVIAPYELSGRSEIRLQVEYNGRLSNPVSVPVTEASPALFTQNSSGTGIAVVLNQDLTLNSPDNPAPAGSLISVYATGAGQTDPPGQTGLAPITPPARPILPMRLLIGNRDAQVLNAGAAPYAPGVLRVDAQVPDGVEPGSASIVLIIGSAQSPPGVFVEVGAGAAPADPAQN